MATNDWEITLLDAYEEEECLWNVSLEDYRDRDKRTKSLERIAQKVQKPVSAVKKKIENIRSYYNKELAKLKESQRSGAGAAEVYQSKWVHFITLDSFLRNQVVARKSTSNLDMNEENDCDENSASDNDSLRTETSSQPPKKRTASALFKQQKKRKPEDDLIREASNALKYAARSPTKVTADEHDVFGQHVANELRLITDFRARQYVKLRIQNALFEAQFNTLQGSQQQRHPFQTTLGNTVPYQHMHSSSAFSPIPHSQGVRDNPLTPGPSSSTPALNRYCSSSNSQQFPNQGETPRARPR